MHFLKLVALIAFMPALAFGAKPTVIPIQDLALQDVLLAQADFGGFNPEDQDVILEAQEPEAPVTGPAVIVTDKSPIVVVSDKPAMVAPAIKVQEQVNEKKEQEKPKIENKEKEEKEGGPKKPKKLPLLWAAGDNEFRLITKFKPEFFYGKNLRLLNNNNPTDRVVYFRHTLDIVGEYRFGKPTHPYDIALFKIDIRNRGIWGDPESIAQTTESEIKRIDIINAPHRHGIPRHILWIREMWLQMAWNEILCFPFKNYHTFTVGSFPFELGRGITLGSAFGTGPDVIGYFSENAIDQYAFGAKFSGELYKNHLLYDLYGAFMDNKSDTYEYTNAKVRAQEYFEPRKDVYRRINTSARGFGNVNYVIAARLKGLPLNRINRKITFEPYVLFNQQREQRIEFVDDAHSKLITIGLAGEFELGRFEFGFDTAHNFGNQYIKGWDRNMFVEQNRDGFEVIANSQVKQKDPVAGTSLSALHVPENQKIINNSTPGEDQNGKVIGSNNRGVLTNSTSRFRDPYCVLYKGTMAVFDFTYYILNPDLRISGTAGYASGDENPHKNLEDFPDNRRVIPYKGFISVQETYSGVRVKSAFLLSGSGKVPRVLSFPSEQVVGEYPSTVARFTNLIFGGGALNYRLSKSRHKWVFNPNILAYWQDYPTIIRRNPCRTANEYLGVEVNLFAEAELLPDLRFFFVGALFHPGRHYRDIAGLPLNKEQAAYLEELKRDEDDTEDIRKRVNPVPLLGHDNAWFINFGLEYKF